MPQTMERRKLQRPEDVEVKTPKEHFDAVPEAQESYRATVPKPSDEEWNKMTEKQKRLFNLRLKMNEARMKNHKEVIEENKRENEDKVDAQKRRRREWEAEQEKLKEEQRAMGLDPEKERLLQSTVKDAEWLEKTAKKKKKEATFGWDQYNPEAHFNAYNRRLKTVGHDDGLYDVQREKMQDEEFYRGAHYLGYGQAPEVPEERVNKMVEELEANIAKRKNFSRRRAFNEEEYVTGINERNVQFNKKANRAYDQYTQEIKQNLERGTAI